MPATPVMLNPDYDWMCRVTTALLERLPQVIKRDDMTIHFLRANDPEDVAGDAGPSTLFLDREDMTPEIWIQVTSRTCHAVFALRQIGTIEVIAHQSRDEVLPAVPDPRDNPN